MPIPSRISSATLCVDIMAVSDECLVCNEWLKEELTEEPCLQRLYTIINQHWRLKRLSKKSSSQNVDAEEQDMQDENVDAEYPEVDEGEDDEVGEVAPSTEFDVDECTAELLLELGAIESAESSALPEKGVAESDDYFPDNQLGLEPSFTNSLEDSYNQLGPEASFTNSLEDSYGDLEAALDEELKELDLEPEVPEICLASSESVAEEKKFAPVVMNSSQITLTEEEEQTPLPVTVNSSQITPTEEETTPTAVAVNSSQITLTEAVNSSQITPTEEETTPTPVAVNSSQITPTEEEQTPPPVAVNSSQITPTEEETTPTPVAVNSSQITPTEEEQTPPPVAVNSSQITPTEEEQTPPPVAVNSSQITPTEEEETPPPVAVNSSQITPTEEEETPSLVTVTSSESWQIRLTGEAPEKMPAVHAEVPGGSNMRSAAQKAAFVEENQKSPSLEEVQERIRALKWLGLIFK